MKYHELSVPTAKSKKRVGRGIAAGQGKTAGRGTKGQNSRTGKKLNATFMGGQGTLVRRIPKQKGFKSLHIPAQVVYLNELESLKSKTADNMSLYEAGLVSTPYHTVKVIARGEITKAINLKVQAASASVKEAIKKAGGSVELEPVPNLPASKRKKT